MPKFIHDDGIFEGMSYDEYDAVDALNGSRIVHMRRSPMHYRFMCDHPQPSTPAQEFGTIAHRMILEPYKLGKIAVWGKEEWMKVRRGGRWEEWRDKHEGQTIMTESDYRKACMVSVCALAHKPIGRYANADGPTEVSMFWTHPIDGQKYKARLDKLIPDENTIFDLKTTRDCHSFKFGGQAYALGYHIKAALYVQGYQILTGIRPEFRIGAIESNPPHESAVYRLTSDIISQGWEELDDLLAKIRACEKSGKWPAEHDEETDLLLPNWAMNYESSYFDEETSATVA